MKKNITPLLRPCILIFLLVQISPQVLAQDSSKRIRKMVFEAKVYNADNKLITENYLLQVNDSGILLGNNPDHFSFAPYSSNPVTLVNYKDIGLVKIRRKGSIGRGALIGAVTGIVVGALGGLISGDDDEEFNFPRNLIYPQQTAGQKAVSYGIMFGLLGGVTGFIVGALAKKTFTINRNPSALKELNTTLLERIYNTSGTAAEVKSAPRVN